MLNLSLFNTFPYKKPYMWIYLNERKKTENLDDYRMKIGQTPDETELKQILAFKYLIAQIDRIHHFENGNNKETY